MASISITVEQKNLLFRRIRSHRVLRGIGIHLINLIVSADCYDTSYIEAIDRYYRNTVSATQYADDATSIIKVPHRSPKSYWNEDLNLFREDCIFGHNLSLAQDDLQLDGYHDINLNINKHVTVGKSSSSAS